MAGVLVSFDERSEKEPPRALSICSLKEAIQSDVGTP